MIRPASIISISQTIHVALLFYLTLQRVKNLVCFPGGVPFAAGFCSDYSQDYSRKLRLNVSSPSSGPNSALKLQHLAKSCLMLTRTIISHLQTSSSTRKKNCHGVIRLWACDEGTANATDLDVFHAIMTRNGNAKWKQIEEA